MLVVGPWLVIGCKTRVRLLVPWTDGQTDGRPSSHLASYITLTCRQVKKWFVMVKTFVMLICRVHQTIHHQHCQQQQQQPEVCVLKQLVIRGQCHYQTDVESPSRTAACGCMAAGSVQSKARPFVIPEGNIRSHGIRQR